MDWGMKNRLSRLIQKDGKALFLPIDHGYFQGPTHKLERPGETIKPLIQYADAIMLTRGVLRNCISGSPWKIWRLAFYDFCLFEQVLGFLRGVVVVYY